jgi:hypothetical protein
MAHDRLHSVKLKYSLVDMQLDHLAILLYQASLAELMRPYVHYQLIHELVRLFYLRLLDVLLVIEVLRQWLANRLDLLHFHDCTIVMSGCI